MVRFVVYGKGAKTRLCLGVWCVVNGIEGWGWGCYTNRTHKETRKDNAESADEVVDGVSAVGRREQKR